MRKRALFAAVFAGVVLLGCASKSAVPFMKDCNAVNCHIKISVEKGDVVTDPPIARITGNKHVLIEWHLDQGLEFSGAGDGIKFKGDTRDQFYDGKVTVDKKNFHFRDKNTVRGYFDYSISFHDKDGKPYYKDPTIMNDG